MNSETVAWLCSENIHHSAIQKWVELLELLERKEVVQNYELKTTVQEQGHQVLRLSPYHCQYNSTQLKWIQMKGYITEKNTFKIDDIKKQTYEATCHITILTWEKFRDFTKGFLRDEIVKLIITNAVRLLIWKVLSFPSLSAQSQAINDGNYYGILGNNQKYIQNFGQKTWSDSMHRWEDNTEIWIHLAQDSGHWWTLVNILMSLWVAQNPGNFLSSWVINCFSSRVLRHVTDY